MSRRFDLSLNKELVKRIVVDTATSEKVIEAVLGHQFDSIVEALRHNNTVEISGFGKFILSPRKVELKRMEFEKKIARYNGQLNDSSVPKEKKELVMKSLGYVMDGFNEFKARTDGMEKVVRGVAKQHLPSKKTREENQGDSSRQDEDLQEM